mmetsp:Transcript_26706/g.39498  ORF Transcript_26706/g.39498 Transcript_26706/m.39498 type:complete len:291 (+) Transcript_26706:112-984(+)
MQFSIEKKKLYSWLVTLRFDSFVSFNFFIFHRTFIRYQIVPLTTINDIQSIRSHTNPSNRYTNQFLYTQHVTLAIERQVTEFFHLGYVFRPAGHDLVLHVDFTEHAQRRRHAANVLALVLVGLADFHFRQSRQHVEFGQIQRRHTVDESRVLHLRNIQPSATTRPAGGRAVLGTHLTQVHADAAGRVQFRREGSLSDAGAVGLDGAVNGTQFVGTDAQTRQHGADARIGRGHVRVGPKVDIEHGRVGALHQYFFTLFVLIVGVLNGIDRHGGDTLRNGFVVGQLRFDVNL